MPAGLAVDEDATGFLALLEGVYDLGVYVPVADLGLEVVMGRDWKAARVWRVEEGERRGRQAAWRA